MEISKKQCSKLLIGFIISLCTFIGIYFWISIYFINHFYFGSTINCFNISGKTVEQADDQISSQMESYSLELEEKGGSKEQINGKDIAIKYNLDGKIQSFKDKQKPFTWITGIFTSKDSKSSDLITYDENLLKKSVDKLSCLDSNIVEPKNVSFKYTDNGYEIVDEVYGNKINKYSLYESIKDAISNGQTTINLESANCYENPKYTSKSQKAVDTKNILNDYVNTTITYDFGDKTEVLNGSTINNWLQVDDDLGVTFNEKEVKKYVDTLASNYDTVGKPRDFVTTSGLKIKVSGGTYGWEINKSEEVKDLISLIKEKKSTTKEPIYSQKGISHDLNDIGNTYVEVNMSRQHLWFYKNGSLVTDGPVVTGNVSDGCGTPAGVYKLNYKERNATLKGQGYSSPVSYWMPFNGGIGIHDANWRSVFGGNIYRTSGSHGCVNSPYSLAQSVYQSIDEGTPIVCYYE